MGLSLPRVLLADVVISEIMFDPQGVDKDLESTAPYDREWVEIFNAGSAAVDLSGWQFGQTESNLWSSSLPSATVLAPQQALVITGDATTFDAQWGIGVNRIEVNAFPDLALAPAGASSTFA